ncbi:MAG: ATP-dependent Clp protease ATP-binding subunit [Oscillospiraceae bacterium]
MDGNDTKSEGLCLKCAKELHIKPVEDMMQKMGISDEDLDGITNEMMSAFGGAEGLEGLVAQPGDEEADDDDDDGRTATFPFLSKLFGSAMNPPTPTPDQTPTPGRTERSSRDEAPGGKGERAPKRKFLENYCISLTQKAADGKLDRVIGRDAELSRAIQILNRRQKNNPCLIGEPGVGKTAIAEGLALRIFNHDVPYKLLDKEVYLLDLTALVAGTQFRGQFESRMKGLIEEIRKLGNIILVIDEVHNIVGAGDAEGSMNAANILKPALSRGEIQVIGATTLTEYRKYIEKDAALERRFQPITVEEPSIEDAVEIIKGIAPYYEEFHHVTISPDISRLAVTMSERYITDRFLPDKAIDLIDEACSDVNLHNKALARTMAIDKELADLEKEREVILAAESRMKQAENPTDAQNAETEKTYQRIAELKSIELRLTGEKDALSAEAAPPLTAAHLARVIELWTKIPASQIQAQEFERLAQLETRLKAHIVGQDEAVASVAAAIRRGRVGISPKRKPVSFIFVGATGVGKTELVKQLSSDLFDTPDSLIRIDMSEYMEKHTVSRLIGSPPGYVGYEEGGQLTEAVRRKPYSVVLFDEIEKAHPDVFNILLQVLDDGRITDSQGRTVDFKNTVIILTSNLGSEFLLEGMGADGQIAPEAKSQVEALLKRSFRPEFLNRLDEIVFYKPLSRENVTAILDLMVAALGGRLEEQNISVTLTPAAKAAVMEGGYDPLYGARPLRRYLQHTVETLLSRGILSGTVKPGDKVTVDAQDGVLVLK